MIQRIQTIFLFFVAVLLITFLFLPYWQNSAKDITLFSYGYQFIEGKNTIIKLGFYTTVAILAGIGALISLVEIFMFKNRILQIKMSVINSFVMMITIGLMAYFIYELSMPGNFKLGSFALAMAMFMNIVARRFIKKDENLVRSINRIR